MKFLALFLIVIVTSVISADFISKKNIPIKTTTVNKEKPILIKKKQLEPSHSKKDEWKDPIINSFYKAEQLITVIKNQNNTLPYKNLDEEFLLLSIGSSNKTFLQTIKLFIDVDDHIVSDSNALNSDQKLIVKKAKNIIIVGNTPIFDFNLNEFLNGFNGSKTLVYSGNPGFINNKTLDNFDAIVLTYTKNNFTENRAAQLLFGAIPAIGKLNDDINEYYSKGFGITYPWSGRLKFSSPQELGISAKKLMEIDSIALKGIKEGAYPGCQIVAAVDGKIFYRKSFGSHTYKKKTPVKNTDIFDLASITKIAASTTCLMYLQSQNKFDVSKELIDYIPDLVEDNKFGHLGLKEILCHQSGLHPWIPFYLKTIKNGALDTNIYNSFYKEPFTLKVADKIFISKYYADTMYHKIKNKKLNEKKYKYSDLGYFYIKKIIEKINNQNFEFFVKDHIYSPLGFRTLCFNPLKYFPKNRIVPSENDNYFRKQILQGHVHDMGAAMLGGVCGHAGLFGNATDLASLFQMFLNKGMYLNNQFINSDVIDLYTKKQYPDNHRAIGFDKKKSTGKSTCNDIASNNSFGHSGFTGTLAWADPDNKLNYVFLSNRVYPTMDNRKIITLDTRREIQRVLYEAIQQRNK